MDNAAISPAALWAQAFERVRKTIASPITWLAMQAAQPITIEGNFFVVGLPHDQQYLASNLQTFETVTAIEDSLRETAGHILAFRLINGVTLADWEAVRHADHSSVAAPEPQPASAAPRAKADVASDREVFPTWDKLNERLPHLFKTAPGVRYPHGQARFVLEAVKYISDTMDAQGWQPGQIPDDAQERALSRVLERFSGTVNLDPIFLAMELFRYRQSQGR